MCSRSEPKLRNHFRTRWQLSASKHTTVGRRCTLGGHSQGGRRLHLRALIWAATARTSEATPRDRRTFVFPVRRILRDLSQLLGRLDGPSDAVKRSTSTFSIGHDGRFRAESEISVRQQTRPGSETMRPRSMFWSGGGSPTWGLPASRGTAIPEALSATRSR